jgi:hypothetical protein
VLGEFIQSGVAGIDMPLLVGDAVHSSPFPVTLEGPSVCHLSIGGARGGPPPTGLQPRPRVSVRPSSVSVLASGEASGSKSGQVREVPRHLRPALRVVCTVAKPQVRQCTPPVVTCLVRDSLTHSARR